MNTNLYAIRSAENMSISLVILDVHDSISNNELCSLFPCIVAGDDFVSATILHNLCSGGPPWCPPRRDSTEDLALVLRFLSFCPGIQGCSVTIL